MWKKGNARLNAPFGARCFLTDLDEDGLRERVRVLMYLLALGAF